MDSSTDAIVAGSFLGRGASITISEENGIEMEGPYRIGQDIQQLVSTLKFLTSSIISTSTFPNNNNHNHKTLRLSNLRFEWFDPIVVQSLYNLLQSRIWDRITVVYCNGGIPIQFIAKQCQRLELYGAGPNWDNNVRVGMHHHHHHHHHEEEVTTTISSPPLPTTTPTPTTISSTTLIISSSSSSSSSESSAAIGRRANNNNNDDDDEEYNSVDGTTSTSTTTSTPRLNTTTTTTTTTSIWNALGCSLQQRNSPLRFLRVRTRFQRDTMSYLAEGLQSPNCQLEELHFTSEFVDDDSMTFLANGLKFNTSLDKLTFYSCEFGTEIGFKKIIQAIMTHPTLRVLELQDNNCYAMSTIVSLLQSKNSKLQKLNLYYPPHIIHNNIQVPRIDTESLSMALQCSNTTNLKHLVLPSNALHDVSASWLAMALRVNTTLETLDLTGNVIGDEGAIALADALPEMQGLKCLYLWNNQFRSRGANALAEGMKQNVILEHMTTFSKFKAGDTIQFYTHLNQAGRRILRHPDTNASVPSSLWPFILGRVNHNFTDTWGGNDNDGVSETASVLYSLLLEGGHEQIFC